MGKHVHEQLRTASGCGEKGRRDDKTVAQGEAEDLLHRIALSLAPVLRGSIVVPCVSTVINRLRTKVTCPASETAESASCSRKPTIMASEALTAAVMKLWKAMGSTIENSRRLKAVRFSCVLMPSQMPHPYQTFGSLPFCLSPRKIQDHKALPAGQYQSCFSSRSRAAILSISSSVSEKSRMSSFPEYGRDCWNRESR